MFPCEIVSGFVGSSKSDKDWGVRMDCEEVTGKVKLWELGDGVELHIGSDVEFFDGGIFWGIDNCWWVYIWGDGVFREFADTVENGMLSELCWEYIWGDGVFREFTVTEENGMLSELDDDSKGDNDTGDIGDRKFWTVPLEMLDAACALVIDCCWLAECKFV